MMRPCAASRAARSSLAAEFENTILANADAALLPVMAIRTPPAVETDPASPAFRARTLYDLSRFTRFVNMLGFPTVAIPVGFDDRGLPVAMQVLGVQAATAACLRLLQRFSQRLIGTPGYRPAWPTSSPTWEGSPHDPADCIAGALASADSRFELGRAPAPPAAASSPTSVPMLSRSRRLRGLTQTKP